MTNEEAKAFEGATLSFFQTKHVVTWAAVPKQAEGEDVLHLIYTQKKDSGDMLYPICKATPAFAAGSVAALEGADYCPSCCVRAQRQKV